MTGSVLAWPELTLRLGIALLLGGVIGFERQWRQRIAGLRTNALVALGAAVFVVYASLSPDASSSSRVVAQIASGIGFLGAGVIMRNGGLNTAAALWCSAGVGTFAGSGYYIEAAVTAILVILTNVGLRPLVQLINRQPLAAAAETHYAVQLGCRETNEEHVRSLLMQSINASDLRLHRLESRSVEGADQVTVTAILGLTGRNDSLLEQAIGHISLDPAVVTARWEITSST